jgi:HEAT repeat protein
VKVELERARSAAVYEIQIPATGALAALGDKQALEDLHRLAREGEFRARNLALDMCGYVADEASMRLLKQAAESSDPQVSFAAKRTLARIKGIPPPPPPDPPPPPSDASGSDNR